jgi:hypothetical protein
MSTIAIAGLINHAVARMPPNQAYVNVGVWHGFSLLSGMLGNPEKPCVGIDNFSQFAGQKGFNARFEAMKGPAHRFHEMDYRDYFRAEPNEPFGVYLYDGDHAYEHQLHGLEIAEPFFADGCIVLVDDTNWPAPHSATVDFVKKSSQEYRVLLDRGTAALPHPTFWNGLIVLEATGKPRSKSADQIASEFAPPALNGQNPSSSTDGGGTPLVSMILLNDEEDAESLRVAIEACLAQTWTPIEVLVVDRSNGDFADAYGDMVLFADGIAKAVAATRGEYVGFANSDVPLRQTAVQMALEFPDDFRFLSRLAAERYAEKERALLDG